MIAREEILERLELETQAVRDHVQFLFSRPEISNAEICSASDVRGGERGNFELGSAEADPTHQPSACASAGRHGPADALGIQTARNEVSAEQHPDGQSGQRHLENCVAGTAALPHSRKRLF